MVGSGYATDMRKRLTTFRRALTATAIPEDVLQYRLLLLSPDLDESAVEDLSRKTLVTRIRNKLAEVIPQRAIGKMSRAELIDAAARVEALLNQATRAELKWGLGEMLGDDEDPKSLGFARGRLNKQDARDKKRAKRQGRQTKKREREEAYAAQHDGRSRPRKANPWIDFVKANRADLVRDNPTLRPTEVMKRLGEMYRSAQAQPQVDEGAANLAGMQQQPEAAPQPAVSPRRSSNRGVDRVTYGRGDVQGAGWMQYVPESVRREAMKRAAQFVEVPASQGSGWFAD